MISPAGPLQAGEGSSFSGMDVTELNTLVGFGANVLTNTGSESLTLDIIGLLANSQLEANELESKAPMQETFVIDYTDGGEQFLVGPWPTERPIGTLHPVNGYTVEPGSTIELVVVVKVAAEGVLQWDGLAVKYSYDGTEYVATTEHGLVLCSPPSEEGDCRATI
ncbi:MAG: hypothetical protein ACR2J5_01570 [Geodermatophilaceae bacterium]